MKAILTIRTPPICKNYAIPWGSAWHKSPLNQGISTENMAYGPKNMAYEHPLLCHMSRYYWGWGWSSVCWVKGRFKGHGKGHSKECFKGCLRDLINVHPFQTQSRRQGSQPACNKNGQPASAANFWGRYIGDWISPDPRHGPESPLPGA